MDFHISKTKPNSYYYTDILCSEIIDQKEYTITLFQLNLQKEKKLPLENSENLISFFKSLNKSSFIEKPDILPDKPEYKIFIEHGDEKFVINVFNDKYVSIHPWDGTFSEDFIIMTNINKLYNLYDLCNYFYK